MKSIVFGAMISLTSLALQAAEEAPRKDHSVAPHLVGPHNNKPMNRLAERDRLAEEEYVNARAHKDVVTVELASTVSSLTHFIAHEFPLIPDIFKIAREYTGICFPFRSDARFDRKVRVDIRSQLPLYQSISGLVDSCTLELQPHYELTSSVIDLLALLPKLPVSFSFNKGSYHKSLIDKPRACYFWKDYHMDSKKQNPLITSLDLSYETQAEEDGSWWSSANFPHLKNLALRKYNMQTIFECIVCSIMPSLESLDVSGSYLLSANLEIFPSDNQLAKEIGGFSRLIMFDVSCCKIENLNFIRSDRFRLSYPALKSLNLTDNPLRAGEIEKARAYLSEIGSDLKLIYGPELEEQPQVVPLLPIPHTAVTSLSGPASSLSYEVTPRLPTASMPTILSNNFGSMNVLSTALVSASSGSAQTEAVAPTFAYSSRSPQATLSMPVEVSSSVFTPVATASDAPSAASASSSLSSLSSPMSTPPSIPLVAQATSAQPMSERQWMLAIVQNAQFKIPSLPEEYFLHYLGGVAQNLRRQLEQLSADSDNLEAIRKEFATFTKHMGLAERGYAEMDLSPEERLARACEMAGSKAVAAS